MFFGILESRCLCLSWVFSLHVLFGMRALECFRICFGLSSTWFPSVLHGDAVDAGAVGLPPACFLFQLLRDFWFLSLSLTCFVGDGFRPLEPCVSVCVSRISL